MTAEPLRLTSLEVSAGGVLGEGLHTTELPSSRGLSPLAALEEVILPALARAPCLVSFSGGRDSSTVLAAAARAARREGLPLPVPVSLRFRDAPGAGEAAWQEKVVSQLELPDWERIELGDELDFVGPTVTCLLRRHGLIYPEGVIHLAPLLERAGPGAILTGYGGDDIFGRWRFGHLADVLGRRARPTLLDAAAIGFVLAPRSVRRRVLRTRIPRLSWLRPAAQRAVASARARQLARQPVSWSRRLAWNAGQRHVTALRAASEALAADTGALIVHPLLEPLFLAALARAGGHTGLGGRTAIMRIAFDGLLSDELLAREDKAVFHFAYFRDPSRRFARQWAGGGVDEELVDPEALRAVWLRPIPHGRSVLLLQSAWLTSAAGQLEQPITHRG